MATENLQIPDIAASQNQKEVTANAAHNLLDRAMNKNVQKTITGSTSLTITEARENILIELTGTPGAAFNLDMPDTNKRTLAILNNTGQQVTVRNSAGAGADQPVIANGDQSFFHYDGVDFTVLGGGAGTFLDLPDTPGSYAGEGLKSVRVNSGASALEFFTTAAGVGRVPFRGSLITNSTNTNNINGGVTLAWNTETYDTDSFHDPVTNNSRFTIPTGVTRVRLKAQLALTNFVVVGETFMDFRKNGASLSPSVEGIFTDASGGFNNRVYQLQSSVIDVVAGDFLELKVNNSSTVNDDVLATGTWFAIEVVEDDNTANYDLHGWFSGTPVVSVVTQRFVLPRVFTIVVSAIPSEGHVGTTASAQTDFDLQKNGVSFGTMGFANASAVAVFTVASATTFAAADRLDVVAPANLNGLADLSFTLAGVL